MRFNLSILVSIVLALAACDGKQSAQEPSGAIPESHMKAMEKAKGVEDLLDESYEQRKKAADQG